MIFFKITIDILCGILNSLGGYHWLFCRRYIMPVVLAVAFSLIIHVWWVGLMVLPVMGTLCLGYFPWGWFGRASWLGLQAVVIGAGACLTGHFAWYFYFPCVVLAFLAGGLLYDLQQIYGDVIFGMILALPLFFIH